MRLFYHHVFMLFGSSEHPKTCIFNCILQQIRVLGARQKINNSHLQGLLHRVCPRPPKCSLYRKTQQKNTLFGPPKKTENWSQNSTKEAYSRRPCTRTVYFFMCFTRKMQFPPSVKPVFVGACFPLRSHFHT